MQNIPLNVGLLNFEVIMRNFTLIIADSSFFPGTKLKFNPNNKDQIINAGFKVQKSNQVLRVFCMGLENTAPFTWELGYSLTSNYLTHLTWIKSHS